MDRKFFRFNMADDSEDCLFGYYNPRKGEITEDVNEVTNGCKLTKRQAYQILCEWLNECNVDINTDEVEDAIEDVWEEGSIVVNWSHYDPKKIDAMMDGTIDQYVPEDEDIPYTMTIEVTDDLDDWKEEETVFTNNSVKVDNSEKISFDSHIDVMKANKDVANLVKEYGFNLSNWSSKLSIKDPKNRDAKHFPEEVINDFLESDYNYIAKLSDRAFIYLDGYHPAQVHYYGPQAQLYMSMGYASTIAELREVIEHTVFFIKDSGY